MPTQLTVAEKALHDQSNLLPQRQLILVLIVVALPFLISFIDQNGISTVLPTIAADLDARATMSWAGTSSLIANTTFQMLYGRLSDIFGRKTIFIGAVALLALADLMCGLSRSATMFYIFRGIAGIGGGGITNLGTIILSDVVTLEQRGKYQGIVGSMIGLGSVIGPFIGAAFVSHSTWRGFFYLLAPLSAVNCVVAAVYLPGKPPAVKVRESVGKIDWMGTLTSSVGIIFLLIPISGGGAYFSWSSPMVISMLAIGSVALVLFVVVEWKFAALPMMPVSMYHNPVIVVLLLQSFLLGFVYQAFVYYVPLYLQNAHQFSIIISALIIAPIFGLQSLTSVLSGLWITRYKKYGVIIRFGFGMWTLGAGLTLIYRRTTNPGIILVPLLLSGVGVGCVFQPMLVAVQAHSVKSRRAVIISNRNFCRCAGGACGLAVSAAVLQARLRATLPAEYAYLASSPYTAPDHGSFPTSVYDAYMAASHAVFILQVPVIGLCFLASFLVKDRGLAPKEELNPDAGVQGQPDDAAVEAAEAGNSSNKGPSQ